MSAKNSRFFDGVDSSGPMRLLTISELERVGGGVTAPAADSKKKKKKDHTYGPVPIGSYDS